MTGRINGVEALGQFAVFAAVEPQTRVDLAHASSIERWSAGQTIFQRGDGDSRLLAIIAGQVRLSLIAPQGKELVLKVLGPWEMLGELAVLDGMPRSADAVALEPTTALVFTREKFLAVCAARPDLPLSLARYLAGLLRATNFQMESIALYDLQSRLIRFLLFAVEHSHGPKPPKKAPIDVGLNQSDLAAALGATRPRVNNALQDLISIGAIQRDGGRIVCNVPKLRALADLTPEDQLL